MDFLKDKLTKRKNHNIYRVLHPHFSAPSTNIYRDNQTLLNFSSNDYLGLANNCEVKKELTENIQQYGVGSGSAHLICGHHLLHQKLEHEISAWLKTEASILLSTGYMANAAVLQTLVQRQDLIIQDKLIHASLIQAAKLTQARMIRYNHNDLEHLEYILDNANTQQRKFIVTEGTFSMDGDHPPLKKIIALKKKYNAYLIIDEAHSLGVCGKLGTGIAHPFQKDIDATIGTFGKAFGTFGAFVSGSKTLIESIIQFAPSYIYTTALPPALAAATSCSLNLIQKSALKRERLKNLISYFRSQAQTIGLQLMPSASPIQPIIIGDANKTLKLANKLLQNNILAVAIRPPTVPQGSARLRITINSEHTFEDIDRLIRQIETASDGMS